MDWNLDSSRPIWPQIEAALKRLIVSGQVSPGDPFPSVRELANDAKVNPNTMQRALSELEHDELLVTMRTSGRRVTDRADKIEEIRKEIADECVGRYLKEMRSLGYDEEQMVMAIREGWKGGDQ